MKKRRFTEKEILEVLNEAEQRVAPPEIADRYGISVQTFYRWRKKYGSQVASEERRLKELDEENARLKKLLIQKELENHALKDSLEKTRGH